MVPGQVAIGEMLTTVEAVVLIPAKERLVRQRGDAPGGTADSAIGSENAVKR